MCRKVSLKWLCIVLWMAVLELLIMIIEVLAHSRHVWKSSTNNAYGGIWSWCREVDGVKVCDDFEDKQDVEPVLGDTWSDYEAGRALLFFSHAITIIFLVICILLLILDIMFIYVAALVVALIQFLFLIPPAALLLSIARDSTEQVNPRVVGWAAVMPWLAAFLALILIVICAIILYFESKKRSEGDDSKSESSEEQTGTDDYKYYSSPYNNNKMRQNRGYGTAIYQERNDFQKFKPYQEKPEKGKKRGGDGSRSPSPNGRTWRGRGPESYRDDESTNHGRTGNNGNNGRGNQGNNGRGNAYGRK